MAKKAIVNLAFFLLLAIVSNAQVEETRVSSIHTICLYMRDNPGSLPIAKLGAPEQLELHFDDFQQGSKSYYYTYQLCNADWTPVNLSQMDYLKGFSQNRITQYRFSSIAFTRYVHYQVNLPQTNCMPSKAGNYLLKVFANGDTSKLLFSRRMMVLDEKVTVATQIAQPFTQDYFRTHQKIVTKLNFGTLDVFNIPQQIRLVVLQNYRWDNAQTASNPTFIRGKELEYSTEDNFIFEGGKEWRWLDLRSFRLQSDRVRRIDYSTKPYNVQVVRDTARSAIRYMYYKDLNGQFIISTLEDINPWWQGDYANVHFTFMPNNPEEFRRRDIFVMGQLTNYDTNPENAMVWSEERQAFEKDLLLKNGYYSYAYVTREKSRPELRPTFRYTEGTVWDAENTYTVLVYYRPFGGRSDELLGFAEISSLRFLNTPVQ